MAEVQTPAVSSSKDNALFFLAIVVILGGIAAFYVYDERPLPLRIGMVVVGLAAGAGLMWLSSYGREFVQFFQAARVELRKVVWPDRQETVRTTVIVFVFAAFMGVFFFVLDWVLTLMTRFLGGQTG
jgi:preprotein translocase subunit SecE